LLKRWFAAGETYAASLARFLCETEVLAVQDLFTRYLRNQTVIWESTIAFVRARIVGESLVHSQYQENLLDVPQNTFSSISEVM